MPHNTDNDAISLADITDTLSRISERADAEREASVLVDEHKPTPDQLDAILVGIQNAFSNDIFTILGLPQGSTEEQFNERLLHLSRLLFYIGKKAYWSSGIREGALLTMQAMIDRLQKYDDAIEWGSMVLEESGDPQMRQIVFGDIGLAFTYKRDLTEAIRNISAAVEIARAREDKYLVAKYLGDLGAAYARCDDFEMAEKHYEMALKAAREVPGFPHTLKFRSDLQIIREAIREGKEDILH